MLHCWVGTYGVSALTVAIGRYLGDKNIKFIEKPLMSECFEKNNLTQEEIDNRELQKMLLAEEMWIKNDKKRGLKETIIK